MKMEWVSNIINGSNGKFTLIVILGILLETLYLIKNGTINFNGHGLQVGKTRESELRIVREQLQYMEQIINGSLSKVPEKLRSGEYFYKVKYWWSKWQDSCENIIIYNHLTKDDIYIKLKQESTYNLMLSVINDEDAYWKSPEFRGLIYSTMKDLIADLVNVRETYSKKELT